MSYGISPYKVAQSYRIENHVYSVNGAEISHNSTVVDAPIPGFVSEVKLGSSVSDYRKKIVMRTSASSGYQHDTFLYEGVPCLIQSLYYDSTFQRFTAQTLSGMVITLGGYPGPNTSLVNSLDSQAVTKFLANLYSKQTSFSGGIFLGQIKKTIHDIRHPMSALREGFSDYLKSLKRLKGRGSVRHLGSSKLSSLNKAISGSWLEAQYGWKPLLQDIDGGMKALADLSYQSPTDHAAGSATGRGFTDTGIATVSLIGGLSVKFNVFIRYEATVKYTCGFRVVTDSQSLPGSGSFNIGDLGLGLKDFIPTVWDLIPYSFLVDYFANVGQIINASMACTSNVFYCTRSVRDSASVLAPCNPVYTDNFTGASNPTYTIVPVRNIGSAMLNRTGYLRSPVSAGDLVPSLRFYAPAGDSLRWDNMVALGAQARSVSNFLSH